jgi:hypothetical protein
MLLCGECYENIYTWRWVGSLYAFTCKCFRNTRHTNIWNTIVKFLLKHPAFPWKSHWTMTISGKTLCILLHYDSSKHSTCPLNKGIQAFKSVKLFFKHPIFYFASTRKLTAYLEAWASYSKLPTTLCGHVSMPWHTQWETQFMHSERNTFGINVEKI